MDSKDLLLNPSTPHLRTSAGAQRVPAVVRSYFLKFNYKLPCTVAKPWSYK